MSRRLVPAVLIAAFALLAPAAAQADTLITWSQARLAATNDGAGTSVNLYTRELPLTAEARSLFPAFSIGGPVSWSPSDACLEDNGYIVCNPADSFLLQGGGGTDTLGISDEPELNAVPATLNGGGGTDRLQDFSPVARTLDGGDGNDVMFGAGGNDIAARRQRQRRGRRRGRQRQRVRRRRRRQAVRRPLQGPGRRRDRRRARLRPRHRRLPRRPGAVTVTLDGIANDGRAGENDNVIGIEEIEGPQGTYVGSDAAETFTVGAASRRA